MSRNQPKSRGNNEARPSNPTRQVRETIFMNTDESLEDFILFFRTRLGLLGGRQKCKNKYQMQKSPDDMKDSDLVDVQFGKSDKIVQSTVRIRLHDSYTGGFTNEDGDWFQLKGHLPSIPGASILQFGDSYGGLMGKATPEGKTLNLSDILTKRSKMETLKDAVLFLSKFEKRMIGKESEEKKAAYSLLVIVVLCCEGARFNSIASYPFDTLNPSRAKKSSVLHPKPEFDLFTSQNPGWVEILVGNWGNMSDVVKAMDDNPQNLAELDRRMASYGIFVPRKSSGRISAFHIATAEHALDELGIIK